MNEYVVTCPCCGNEMRILIDSRGRATAFLFDKKGATQKELSRDFGIELGIVDTHEEVSKDK